MKRPEAVERELFTQRFAALAREMGESLQRTALSTNVKERLDFSCALLDPEGRLVVNAPHIPVHLGALGLCVRRVRESLPLRPGDVAVTNHPAYGGSHLPDVTVITPVFEEDREDAGGDDAGPPLLGYVASRAHHAEIGGVRPGSMPPAVRRLAEEGVVLPPLYLIRRGRPAWEEVERLLSAGPHPSRSVGENLADLAAAVAANRRGAERLRALARRHGREVVSHFMNDLAAEAGRKAARALAALPAGARRAVEHLDDGSRLEVLVELIDEPRGEGPEGKAIQRRARIDFTGTSGVHPGNLNAPPAVTRSAVLYVLRLLVGWALRRQEEAGEAGGMGADAEGLPLNEGLLEPVELCVPEGMLNPPFPDDPERCPAVVGGNVETSQRVVDTLLKAFGVVAASQGTMNNLLFGNDRFGYYETVAGGCGAGPGFAGASGVHSHMTNTRITDPEILEHRYPVRLERFALRRDPQGRGSGGRGRWPGGDGLVREITFLDDVSLSLLTQRRTEGPYGGDGGEAGRPGRQRLVHPDGSEEELPGAAAREVRAGTRLVLETPGGGGWGTPEPSGPDESASGEDGP